MIPMARPSLISVETLLALRCLARVQGQNLFFLELEVRDLCTRDLVDLLLAVFLVVQLYPMVLTMPDTGDLMANHVMSQYKLNLDQ